MKTLDEVISVMEECFDHRYNIVPLETEPEYGEDALQYLKMYRSDQLTWEANQKAWDLVEEDLVNARMKYIAKLKELDIGTLNDPLTWDELRTMEGKPVWMEADDGKFTGWFVVGNFFSYFEKEDFDAHISLYTFGRAMEFSKETYGGYWQAYRKERG